MRCLRVKQARNARFFLLLRSWAGRTQASDCEHEANRIDQVMSAPRGGGPRAAAQPGKFKTHRGVAEIEEKKTRNGVCEMRNVRVKLLSGVGM
jgi:hypothetical protein